jgi:catechol 2,3-dioxygenase-like lactoylglutathione lyase family enzyme
MPIKPLRILAIAVLSLACTRFDAQSTTTPKLAGIAHVALRVKDLAASIAFYQSLGYEQAFDLRRDNVPYESFIKINDRQFIELYPATDKDPQIGFLHLCFESDDLRGLHDDYTSVGLTPTDVRKAGAGNLLFTMAGPDQPLGPKGATVPENIEYTQYEPGSLHTNDTGKHLGADRVSDRLLGVWLAMKDPAAATEFYTNSMAFKPLPGFQSTLHLPGGSGEEVVITPAALGAKARLTFDTMNLAKALRHLKRENIPTEKLGAATMVLDPDGNQILLIER